jgi:hypothetical protein
MDSPLILFAFLSLFHILGGGVLGVAMRGLRLRDKRRVDDLGAGVWLRSAFHWAAGPMAFSLSVARTGGGFLRDVLFLGSDQRVVRQTRDAKDRFGGLFFVAGCAAAGMLLKAGEIPMAAVFGLVFGGVGLVLILTGMRKMLEPPAGPQER